MTDRYTRTVRERFDAKVEVLEGGCHQWTASLTRGGYGNFSIGGRAVLAHRAAWLLVHRSLPVKPMCLDHLCRNRGCVNVSHLEAITYSLNLQRGTLRGGRADLAKCAKGLHDWVPENLSPTSGGPTCTQCKNAAQRARYALNK